VLRIKAPGHREEVTVIGSLPSVSAGEWLSGEGWWVRDTEHGLQFKASTIRTVPPTTVEGIERYLSSGLVKGIGPVLAKKLVGRFHADVLNVIETRPGALLLVDGIGPKRRERISRAWREAKQVREIMLFLHGHGVSTSRAVRIFKAYGEEAIEKGRSNPYMLAKDIYGIGFAAADQIAQKLGIPKDSLNRARAGLDHVLLSYLRGSLRLASGEAQGGGGETAGGAGNHGRRGSFANAHQWPPAVGGDRRRTSDLPAPSLQGGGGHRGQV
jgi:exodeoxyribonuclease V alpha subunit